MRHVYLGRNNFGSKKKMQLSKKLPARTCSQQQCLLGFNLWGLAHHGCKVRKAVMEPWNPYLADVRLGVDANLPELSLKALKCLNDRLKNTSTFQCCHSFELHRFQCSIKTIQELQKERVREQELVQKQKVPRDLTDYLWNFGLIWSKPYGTVASLKEHF